MSDKHGNWMRLGDGRVGFCCCWQSRDGKRTCVKVATHACNVHDFNSRWCGEARCKKHVPRPMSAKPRLGGKKLRRQGKQRGVCFSGFGCVRGFGHRGPCRDATGVVHPEGRSMSLSEAEFACASSPAAASSGPSKRRRTGASGCHDAGNLTPGAEAGKAKSCMSFTIDRPPSTVFTIVYTDGTEQTSFDRAALLDRLGLPRTARLQFGGREWLQDFDEHARLIVTVTK